MKIRKAKNSRSSSSVWVGKVSTPWAVVLAGGEGTRMRSAIRKWFGEERPKQYCVFTEDRSMFEQTVDRARKLVPEERIISIIGAGHRRFFNPARAVPGRVIEQPVAKDTAAGIMLPVAYARAADPDGTLLIFPSDHYIYPEGRFLGCVGQAAELAAGANSLVLLAAVATGPKSDYGWIVPKTDGANQAIPSNVQEVQYFIEKPFPDRIPGLLDSGGLWNTMIMAVKTQLLWDLGRSLCPELMGPFNRLVHFLQESQLQPDPVKERQFIDEIYQEIPAVNFSYDILQRCSAQTLVLPMTDVEWNDWGHPDRVLETLSGLESQGIPLGATFKDNRVGAYSSSLMLTT